MYMLNIILKKYSQWTTSVGFIACIALASSAYSQTILQSMTRSSGVGARALGMGDTYIAETADVTTIYWNPAALCYVKKFDIVLNHFQEPTFNSMSENLTVPVLLGHERSIAVGVTVNHVGYAKSASTPAFIWNQYRIDLSDLRRIQYGLDLAYASEILTSVSFGAMIGMRYGKIGTSNLLAASSSVGILYSPSQTISYGASYSGIGSAIGYALKDSVSFHRTNLPRSLQIGATLRFPSTAKRPIVIFAIANEKIFGEDGLRYKGGIEVLPVPFLALRAGYLVEPGIVAAKWGAGLASDWLRLDYAIAPSHFSERYQQLSFSISL
jgi:hypothetical protein